jgi:hypothetical protein
MGMMERTLKRLFPPGRAWWLPGNTGLLIEALAVSLETARAFIRAIIAESVPWTAEAMLQEWHAALGVRYDPTQSVAFQQRMLDAVQTAIGNTTLNALNAQIQKELANVTFSEIAYGGTTSIAGESECGFDECNSDVPGTDANPYSYLVSGTVENDAEAGRVISVIAHFAPRHLTATSALVILSDTGTTECGIATCGIEECGYAP